jgi:hypothetical protein
LRYGLCMARKIEDALQPYCYEKLLRYHDIRILILYPGEDSESLAGTIIHHDLDSEFHYETISYVWGGADLCCEISIDGKALKITQNLEMALRNLRFSDKNLATWADGICINQCDRLERNHQVQLMKEIYSRCYCCVIYLGEEADGSGSFQTSLKSGTCSF